MAPVESWRPKRTPDQSASKRFSPTFVTCSHLPQFSRTPICLCHPEVLRWIWLTLESRLDPSEYLRMTLSASIRAVPVSPALRAEESSQFRQRHAIDDVLRRRPGAPGDADSPDQLHETVRVRVGVDRQHAPRVDRGAGVDVIQIEPRIAAVDFQSSAALRSALEDLVQLQRQS